MNNINWNHNWYYKACTINSLFFIALWVLAAVTNENFRNPLNVITAFWLSMILISVIMQIIEGDER